MSHNNPHSSARGFTLVEMLVIAPIVILVIGAFITVIVNMTGDVLAARSSTLLTYNIQSALNQIQTDVKLSSGFLAQSNISEGISNVSPNPNSPQGYSNDTTPFTNVDTTKGNMLILNTLATTANPISTTSGLVYLNNVPNSCSGTQSNQNTPMTFNIVYFVSNNSLWRRVIMPTGYSTLGCSAPWQRPSCNPTYMATYNPSTTLCATQDEDLVDNITTSGFNLSYFPSASSTIANSVATNTASTVTARNTALQSLTTVSASISVSTTVAGRSITQSGTILATRLGANTSSIYNLGGGATVSIPAAPSGFTVTYNSPGSVTASWYPDGVTQYNVVYATNSSFTGATTTTNTSSTSQTITGLSTSQTYYFEVTATNTAGTGTSAPVTQSASTITNGLIGWWPFDGNANDSSGGGHNGVVTGATLTTGQNGGANGAYKFTAATQTVIASNVPIVNSSATFSAWVDPTSYPSERFTILEGIPSGTAYYLSLYTDHSLQTYWYTKSSPGYFSSGTGTGQTVPLNAWTFVAAVWSSTGASLYVNGNLESTSASTGTGGSSSTVNVGADSSARQFLGAIDDVRVYNRALSSSEIMTLYNAGAQ